MSLEDYNGLKSELAAYAARSDLTVEIDTFIDISEAYFNRKFALMDLQDMESTSTLVTVAGTSLVALPSDFQKVKVLEHSSSPKSIDFITQKKLTDIHGGNSTGRPRAAARYPGNRLILGPTPDSAYSLPLSYFAKIPALSASVTSNWLLTKSPDIYLYKGLEEIAKFTLDDDNANRFGQLTQNIIMDMEKENNSTRQPSQGMSMRAEVVV